MRKTALGILVVVLGSLALAFAPAAMDQGVWLWDQLPGVEIEGTVVEMGFIDGRFAVTVESEGENYTVLLPVAVIRNLKLDLKVGGTVKVEGKLLQGKATAFVLPENVVKDGKNYEIKHAMRELIRQKMRRAQFERFRNKVPERRMPRGRNW